MDQLSVTLSALADPTRRAILAQLTAGQKTVTELAAPFKITMPAVTKHLKVLERAGLIERRQDAQRRPCQLMAGGQLRQNGSTCWVRKPGLADAEDVDEISVVFPYHDRLVKQLADLQKRLERE